MNKVKVLFFATLRDHAGALESEYEIPDEMTVGEFKKMIGEQYPPIGAALHSVLVAINKEYAFDEEKIPEDAEIALFPPVSGGSDELPQVFSITENEIDLNELLAQVTRSSTGAAAIFTGMVRGETSRGEQHDTAYLEYEAYAPMAEAKMQQVADEIREKWPTVEGIAIVQRVGVLYPKTPTVLIACTAPHRNTGVFEAARYGIDRLKEIVPVWKKEIGPDGQAWVEGEYIPQPGE